MVGQSDSIVGNALHIANSGSIPDTLYGPPDPVGVISKHSQD